MYFTVTTDTAGNVHMCEWPDAGKADWHFRNRVEHARAWQTRRVVLRDGDKIIREWNKA